MLSSEIQLRAFLERQSQLLQRERTAEIERTSLLLSSCSPKLLEKKGLALGGLGVVGINIGLGGKSLIELERPSAYHSTQLFPPHSFRTGDLARIAEHVSVSVPKKTTAKSGKKPTSDTQGVEGVVYKVLKHLILVSDTRIVIAVDSSDSAEDFELPERCRLLKLANSVTYDSLLIDSKNGSHGQSTGVLNNLIQVLLGIIPPSSKNALPDLQYSGPIPEPKPKRGSAEIALIHGPPGTGKTHTLIEIIRQLVAQGKRVLVCGASNLAVDNLLERLLPHGIPATRLGHPARVLSVLHPATLDAQASRSEESALAKDVKKDLESAMNSLTGKGKGRLKGPERRKMWEEVKELRKEYRKREGIVVKTVMAQAKVVLATCHSAGGRELLNARFDVVVIDEATQALEAVCWIPILKANKLILAGDPLQLPPTIMSTHEKTVKKDPAPKNNEKNHPQRLGWNLQQCLQGHINQNSPTQITVPPSNSSESQLPNTDPTSSSSSDSDEPLIPEDSELSKAVPRKPKKTHHSGVLRPSRSLETTLFDRLERMYGLNVKRMLTVQYRMHARIAEFPSNTLYTSSLISHESVASHLLTDLNGVSETSEPEAVADVLGFPVVFFDTSGCEYFERLDDDGSIGDEGSRCNENEAALVKTWVEKLVQAGISPSQIAVITPYQAQIGTVDGMQGREKEAVILSLVRSNDKREVGFLKEKRRLNVAMTRPRRQLCVVGDSSTVSQGSPYLKSWMKWLETHADVRFGEV
ncbi:hypothetical protein BS47DRAFT_1371885 [Hydnum rufescens UP504]|uniref:DNA helicase n=1 Tax=Hydnum rufescens UP504 TaxID=1448309 RepID=A0A9P6B1L9_9AGAM|nr:hypothetical protein BS47DRAFT_1371885 [Hydnum rufescens UP504]